MTRFRLAGSAILLISIAAMVQSANGQVFDERGFKETRDFFSQLPFEHIDPLTGNLLLTHTDLVLPGNAGFDLRIQRTYNSKIFRANSGFSTLDEDSWAGVGWTLHFGRILNGTTTPPNNPPIVEMPDGSRHPMFNHVGPLPPGCPSPCWISRDYWTYNKTNRTLRLPNGLVYTFGHEATVQIGPTGIPVAYVTQISDPFGNTLTMSYNFSDPDVTQVVQNLGNSQSRTVTFTKQNGTLRFMTYNGLTWEYTHDLTTSPGFTTLRTVLPPSAGPGTNYGWSYEYSPATPAAGKYELLKVTTPNGGHVSFTYQQFASRVGGSTDVQFRGVRTRTTGGHDVAVGNWNYLYAQGGNRDTTFITVNECGTTPKTTQLTFYDIGNSGSNGMSWRIGALKNRTVSDGISSQTETYTWAQGLRISNDDDIIGGNITLETYVPLLQTRTVSRNGRTYTTTNTYSSTAQFNDFGRPFRVEENGDFAGAIDRTTTYSFDYAFSGYIKDRIASETVTVAGEPAPFVKSYSYIDATGFKDQETIHELPYDYEPSFDGRGNVRLSTDGSGHATSFTYSWGRVKDTTTPRGFTIRREINQEGTVQWEEKRPGIAYRTNFTYDQRFRLKQILRPVGTPIDFSYDTDGPVQHFDRNHFPAGTRHYLDGFGRVSFTENNVNVKKNTDYDACGRVSFQSLPYYNADSRGTSFQYDALDRMRRRTHSGGAFATFDYSDGGSGIRLRVTNERGKVTDQLWKAFGDPDDARLAEVKDANLKTWTYLYNAMGSLTRVTPPSGQMRQWFYYGPNEANGSQGQLKAERFPENLFQDVTYAYNDDGTLASRGDPQFGTTFFVHDGNHRLAAINYPTVADRVTMDYDEADNRILLANGHVSSSFGYDESNRLTLRTDQFIGIGTYATVFVPDGRDNIQEIRYPNSGVQVTYDYDSENRITKIYRTGQPQCPGTNCFAYDFSYHASGAPISYKSGNNLTNTYSYDSDRYWIRSANVGGALSLTYQTYDAVGNVEDILDSRGPTFNQEYGYDNLDRMTTANGIWGNGSFVYDDRGNRLSKTINGQLTLYNGGSPSGYDPSERLVSATGAEGDNFGYDGVGNLTTQTGRTYTYTPASMMATATVSGATTTYRYDGDNMRKRATSVGSDRFYVHGAGGNLLTELQTDCTATRRTIREYIYAGTRLIAGLRYGQERTVSLMTPVNVGESATSVQVPVRITTSDNQPTLCPVTVTLQTAAGNATPGSDYTTTTGNVTINAGVASNTDHLGPVPPIPLLPDSIDEDNETFTVSITGATQAGVGSPSTQTVTIIDDDDPPFISISGCAVTESTNPPGPATVPCPFNVSLSGPSGKNITVVANTAPGSASLSDYVSRTNVQLQIPPMTTSVPFPVEVVGDTIDEPQETFSSILSNPVNAQPGTMQAAGTITDDDLPPELSILDTRIPDRNFGTTAFSTLRLSNPQGSGFTITVNFATAPNTATAGVDYRTSTGTVTFNPGEVVKAAAVPIIQDTREEGTESFYVDLSGYNPAIVTVPDPRGETFIVERATPPPTCAFRLDPLPDNTPIPVDLLLSEISPGAYVEIYNPGNLPVDLATVQHHLNQEPHAGVSLSSLATTPTIVPARGYARLPWPGFSDGPAGGEMVLFKNNDFNNSLNIVDFVCWGAYSHASRRAQAESVGKWAGPPAPQGCVAAMSNVALHRLRSTDGTTASSYDPTAVGSPMSCVGTFTVTKTSDSADGVCDSDCSLREAVLEANDAAGEDTIKLAKGIFLVELAGPGDDTGVAGDFDITDDLRIAGKGAISSTVRMFSDTSDRVFDVQPGITAHISGLAIEAGDSSRNAEPGGGVRNGGALTLDRVALVNNLAASGGGLHVATTATSTTVLSSSAVGNWADVDGGGVGVDCATCTLTLVGSTLSGNQAAGSGGGLHVDGGTVSVRGSTITANTANANMDPLGAGGGVAVTTGAVSIRNAILAGNSDNMSGAPDCLGMISSEQYNLLGSSAGCFFTPSNDHLDVAALLGPLANNRGPTASHSLLAGSPALDTANPRAPGTGGLACEQRDQRFYLRPWPGGNPPSNVCDKGSFEFCNVTYPDATDPTFVPFISEISCRGIAGGCGGGDFCPGAFVTRTQMAVFVVTSIDEQKSGAPYNQYFTDVPDDGLSGFINRMKELGITGGCGGTNFCPGGFVSRAQMAPFLVAALEEKKATGVPHNAYFADLAGEPLYEYINRLYELGITTGCGTNPNGDRIYCPSANLRRDQMTVWLVTSFFQY